MNSEDKSAAQKDKPAPKETPKFGLPLFLLGTLWSAVSIVFAAYKLINDKRDEIIHILECQRLIGGKTYARAELLPKCLECCDPNVRILGPIDLYFSNLLPLSFGVCLFLVIITYSVWKMPSYMNLDDPETRFIILLIASLPAFALVGFGIGAVFDIYTILQAYFALR
jgi:hypothetical protein